MLTKRLRREKRKKQIHKHSDVDNLSTEARSSYWIIGCLNLLPHRINSTGNKGEKKETAPTPTITKLINKPVR